MVTKMTEWHSKRGPITKIILADGVKEDAPSLGVKRWYNLPETAAYVRNVGSNETDQHG